MKTVYIPVFPGTNCEKETIAWVERNLEVGISTSAAGLVPESLAAAIVPGGFTYGDYLRAGALAARSEASRALVKAREARVPILGICNGFQILCEAKLLPGALTFNQCKHHLHGPVQLRMQSLALKESDRPNLFSSQWLPQVSPGLIETVLREAMIPISCGMGSYVPPASVRSLVRFREGDRPALEKRFFSSRTSESEDMEHFDAAELLASSRREGFIPLIHYVNNEPGSFASIAGISSLDGTILGLMPHPERASDLILGDDSGLLFLLGLAQSRSLRIRRDSPLARFTKRFTGEELK